MVIWDRDAWFDADPFNEFERLRRRINRLFGTAAGTGARSAFPPVNVSSNSEKAVVTAELPGVNKEDIEISVENDVLSFKGHREHEELGEKEVYRRCERGHGTFRRAVELPFAVDPEAVDAGYKDGILRIELNRHEASKPKKIAVR